MNGAKAAFAGTPDVGKSCAEILIRPLADDNGETQ